jgi:hypothetical protein
MRGMLLLHHKRGIVVSANHATGQVAIFPMAYRQIEVMGTGRELVKNKPKKEWRHGRETGPPALRKDDSVAFDPTLRGEAAKDGALGETYGGTKVPPFQNEDL